MKRLLLLAILAVIAWGQSAAPVSYPAGNSTATWVMEPQAVPTSPTVIVTGTSVILGGWVSCASTGRTVTITDGNSIKLWDAVPIPANAGAGLSIYAGAVLPTSITISASGAGCTYSLWGRR